MNEALRMRILALLLIAAVAGCARRQHGGMGTFNNGILVNPDGTFRIADIPTSAPAYKIGVRYDGDGVVDAGISVHLVSGAQLALP